MIQVSRWKKYIFKYIFHDRDGSNMNEIDIWKFSISIYNIFKKYILYIWKFWLFYNIRIVIYEHDTNKLIVRIRFLRILKLL